MPNPIIQRAELLMQQQKYKEAEGILKNALSSSPDDVHTLALLAEVYIQLDRSKEAETIINNAIGIRPDEDFLYYIKARIDLQQDKFDRAEEGLQKAIAIHPGNPDYYALWSSVKLHRKKFEEALQLSGQALELDAENILALNTRSTALLKLKNPEASFITIEGALREDPNNPFTHANYGWIFLERGEHKKALEHFREALRSDPSNEFAQDGMAEALKASNIIYRLFLKYVFWINNLTARYQWGVIIGFYVCFRILRSVANSNENLKPYLNPLLVLLAIVAFSTWVITPISNLFLRLNKFGKHLLGKKEIYSSNFTGISFLLFIIGGLAYLLTRQEQWLPVIIFGFAMMVPLGVMFSPTKYKYSLVIYAGAMAVIGIAAIGVSFSTGVPFNAYTSIFVISFIAFQWIANFLMIKESNV